LHRSSAAPTRAPKRSCGLGFTLDAEGRWVQGGDAGADQLRDDIEKARCSGEAPGDLESEELQRRFEEEWRNS
jgi:hypothetical protein